MTLVAVHQPNYLPWMGYFGKIMDCDVFIFLDNVQYAERSYTNRVQVKGRQGAQWLTQPICKVGRLYQKIQEVELVSAAWAKKHLNLLRPNYYCAPYARQYLQQLAAVLEEPSRSLSACNERLIKWVCEVLRLDARWVRASDLDVQESEPTQRLIALVKAVGGTAYLSGTGGFKYQDVQAFEAAGIEVLRSRSSFPEYPQQWGEFVPGLSIIDLLLNCGPDSLSYLGHGSRAA